MKKIDLGQTIGILANLGVIAGIIFLAVELQQNNQLSEVQVEMALTATQANTVLADIVEQPQLIALMLKDERSLTEVERQRLIALGLRVLRNWQGRYRMVERGLLDPAEVARNIANVYSRETLNYGTPVAGERYRKSFPAGFVEFLDEALATRR